MDSRPSVFVHELMHFDPVAAPPNKNQVPIRDYGPATYGPYKMTVYRYHPADLPKELGSDRYGAAGSALYIADTFHWFVNELYWSITCDHDFNDPPINADTQFPYIPSDQVPPQCRHLPLGPEDLGP